MVLWENDFEKNIRINIFITILSFFLNDILKHIYLRQNLLIICKHVLGFVCLPNDDASLMNFIFYLVFIYLVLL